MCNPILCNDLMLLGLTLAFVFILLISKPMKDIISFYLEYRSGLRLAKTKYGIFCSNSSPQIYKLILIYNLLEKLINIKTSWVKCPRCGVKTWQLAQRQFNWVDKKDGSLLCSCPKCNHVSHWIPGPGLMLLVSDGLDKNTQEKLLNDFNQENEKTNVQS